MSESVSQRTVFYLLSEKGRPVGVSVTLEWTSNDPFAVTLHFPGPTTWTTSRDVLAAGCDGAAGLGDVTVLPDLDDEQWLELVISSPNGRAGFRLPRSVLATFLASTWELMPAGAEVMPDEWLRAVA